MENDYAENDYAVFVSVTDPDMQLFQALDVEHVCGIINQAIRLGLHTLGGGPEIEVTVIPMSTIIAC